MLGTFKDQIIWTHHCLLMLGLLVGCCCCVVTSWSNITTIKDTAKDLFGYVPLHRERARSEVQICQCEL